MEVTNADESTFSDWIKQVPNFLVNSIGTPQLDTAFLILGKLAPKCQRAVLLQQAKLFAAATWGSLVGVIRKMEALEESLFPDLWKVTLKMCEDSFLTKQEWFAKVAGRQCRFMPVPGSNDANTDFFAKCAHFALPNASMDVLAILAKILQGGLEKPFAEVKGKFEKEILVWKVASFLHQVSQLPAHDSLGLEQHVREVVILVSSLESIMTALEPVEAQLEGNKDEKDFIRRYLTSHPLASFFNVCNALFEATTTAENAIPSGYEKFVENKAVGLIKSNMFSRATHNQCLGPLDHLLQFTEALRKCVKLCAALLPAPILTQVKQQEKSVKALHEYGSTVHAMNVLLHRLPGLQPKQRAATVREFLVF